MTNEVRDELAAVSSAELGDLTGRAAQAVVVVTRSGASPTQVDAAWQALETDLLGSASALMTQYDPASAAAAAAAWLNAAAHVASEISGTHWTAIFQEADDIEALPIETPTEILRLIDEGATPHEAVDTLIDEARRVARALLPNPERIADQVADIYAFTQQYPDSRDAILDQAKLCVLDPARPGPDLLEDLLSGIHGCWLVWREYSWGTIDSSDQDVAEDGDRPAASKSAVAEPPMVSYTYRRRLSTGLDLPLSVSRTFEPRPPAATTIVAKALDGGALFKFDAVAATEPSRHRETPLTAK